MRSIVRSFIASCSPIPGPFAFRQIAGTRCSSPGTGESFLANDPSFPYFKIRGGYLTTLRLPRNAHVPQVELIGCSFKRANRHRRG